MRATAYVPQQSAKLDRVLALAREFPFVRPRDVEGIGVPREYLLRLHRTGQLERVGRGLYRLPNSPITEHHNLAQVARRVAQGVICLLSALAFHDVGTQNPFEVWIAIPRGMRHPKLDAPPLRVTTLSGATYAEGIEEHIIEGVTVRIYGVAKTVVDCFRFRNNRPNRIAFCLWRANSHSSGPAMSKASGFPGNTCSGCTALDSWSGLAGDCIGFRTHQ